MPDDRARSADPDRFERVQVESKEDFWRWLEANHGRTSSVWLVTYKASDPERYVSREAVLDALIAYGWVDGRRMKLDEQRTMQLISPRRQQAWAKSYRERAARLEAEGRMRPAGRAAVEQSKAIGQWEATASVDALEVPEDLAAALGRHGGSSWWAEAAPSYRRNVLRWIHGAKRPETRARRVDEVATRAGRGERVPHY